MSFWLLSVFVVLVAFVPLATVRLWRLPLLTVEEKTIEFTGKVVSVVRSKGHGITGITVVAERRGAFRYRHVLCRSGIGLPEPGAVITVWMSYWRYRLLRTHYRWLIEYKPVT